MDYQFKRGDRVVCIESYGAFNVGDRAVVDEDNSTMPYCFIDGRDVHDPIHQEFLKLITKEEKPMENEKPTHIIIVKNTETYKKGGVFKAYGSFWSPTNADEAFTVKPYGDEYIRNEAADLLLDKKIAVPAVEFNPKFVTLEQNDVLVKALADMSKTKKTVKKSK